MQPVDKINVISTILAELISAENRRLNKMLNDVSQKHQQRYGTPAFEWAGSVYCRNNGQPIATLDIELHGEMDTFTVDRDKVSADMGRIKQILVRLARDCNSLQEVRDAFPDCLISLHPVLSTLPRQDAMAFSIQRDKMAKRQFEKILPLLEAYSVTRLLY